jgi:tRNA (mo5U34)-methyltransferase
MSQPLEALPISQDDPRLQGWYHTIELGNGLASKGAYDHRPVVNQYGIPRSLKGKTALDIGTFDGFWAFELEQRGADRVTAIDIARVGDFDWIPTMRSALGAAADKQSNFELAHAMRRSRVDRRICSVYELSPEKVGVFDVVFCGDVLLHLFNPFQALLNICSVTREVAIIQTSLDPELESEHPSKPWLRFGARHLEKVMGEHCTYWLFNTAALREMMEYSGFRVTEPQARFTIPGGPLSTSVVGRFRP